jgi:hypothetical protein
MPNDFEMNIKNRIQVTLLGSLSSQTADYTTPQNAFSLQMRRIFFLSLLISNGHEAAQCALFS